MKVAKVGGGFRRKEKNSSIKGVFCTIMLGLIFYIMTQDYKKYIDNKAALYYNEVGECHYKYEANCKPLNEAFQALCETWRNCSNKSKPIQLTSQIAVQIFAEIINNFCNTLSNRALGSFFAIVTLSFL